MSGYSSVTQQRGAVWVCVVIGIVCIVAGAISGSVGTIGIGVVITVGMLLLLRLERFSRR